MAGDAKATSSVKGIAALNVYKKVALVRRQTDALTFEDEEGNVQTVSDLGAATNTKTQTQAPKPKLEIPTPRITEVDEYDKQVPPTYQAPTSYVRYSRQTAHDLEYSLEYVIDAEDEVWLLNNSKFGGAAKTTDDRMKPQLGIDIIERMLDIMEKATGFETIITTDEAERRIVKHVPQIMYMFPTKARAGIVSVRQVIQDVYTYWVQKRSKLKRPLIRRYWPVTASDDTNPHLVFRPREKEKYKLRKKRQNDMDAFRKMKQLRADFDKVRVLLDMVKRREELQLLQIVAQNERFEQQMYDITDTSGLPRVSSVLKRDSVQDLLDTPKQFEIGPDGLQRKRRRTMGGEATDPSRTSTPAPATLSGLDPTASAAASGMSQSGAPVPTIIAGQNHGEPAPLFLHPLRSRERYVSSWHNAVPFISSYEDSHPTPTFRFRHRPRVGRGGRVCIDRLPYPGHVDVPPVTVFTAGERLPRALQAKERLLDLLPQPIDHDSVSRRIEEMCASAIKEDYDAAFGASAGGPNGDPEENDGEEVLVNVRDWLDTDDQLWGEERYAIGPI